MSKQFEAVTIPKWGIEMTHGRIVSWRYSEGDQIEAGAELVDIETDKIVNSFEARVSGTLAKILVPEEEELPVGALIGVLALQAFEPGELEAFITAQTTTAPANVDAPRPDVAVSASDSYTATVSAGSTIGQTSSTFRPKP